MRNLIVTGAKMNGFKINQKGEGLVSVVKTTYRNKQQKGTFIGIVLTGENLDKFKANPIPVGKGVNISGGTVSIGIVSDKEGNVKPQIIVRDPDIEEANAYGSGLFHVLLTHVRITEDIQEKDNCVNCKAVMNYSENGTDKAMWLYLTFWGDRATRAKAMKLKKGSSIDIDAEIDVSIYSDNGNNYLNIYLTVDDIAYTAIDKNNSAPATPNPAPAAPPTEGPSPEEISQAAPTAAPDSQPSNDGVQESLLEEDDNIYF